MGTNASFYVGRDPETMECLGMQWYDGYPKIGDERNGVDLQGVHTETEYRAKVADTVTHPDHFGFAEWAYTFDSGTVYVSDHGQEWVTYEAIKRWRDYENSSATFPDFKVRQEQRLIAAGVYSI